MLDDLTFDQIDLLVGFAKMSQKSRGYIIDVLNSDTDRLFSLGLIKKGNIKDLSKIKEGQDFYVISEKGRGLVEAMVDYSNGLLNHWEKISLTQADFPLDKDHIARRY